MNKYVQPIYKTPRTHATNALVLLTRQLSSAETTCYHLARNLV